MKITSTQKTIGVIILLLGIAYYAYMTFVQAPPVDKSATDGSTPPVGQDILDLVASFESVSIDPAVFDSPLFKNLKDFTTVLLPEPQGRVNPFAPIGTENASVPVVTKKLK